MHVLDGTYKRSVPKGPTIRDALASCGATRMELIVKLAILAWMVTSCDAAAVDERQIWTSSGAAGRQNNFNSYWDPSRYLLGCDLFR